MELSIANSLGESPSVSVLLVTLNCVSTVAMQARALLAERASRPFEIVVVDGGSTDGTLNVLHQELPDARVLGAPRGIALARNRAIRNATGEFLLFCDADDEVQSGWVAAHTAALMSDEISIGRTVLKQLGDPPAEELPNGRPAPTGTQITGPGIESSLGVPTTLTANLGIRRACFERVGAFDESLATGEDIDWGFRAISSGATFDFTTGAVVVKRMRGSAAGRFRQHVRFGADMVKVRAKHRAVLPPPENVRALRRWAYLVLHLPLVAFDRHKRFALAGAYGSAVGHLIGSARERYLFL